MKSSILLHAAIALASVASPAVAQMRVQGTRPIDPRLRNQPSMMQQQTPQPSQNATVAPSAAQTELQQARATGAATTKPAPVQAVQGAPAAAGPLRRPSYLGGGENVPSAGPSSLDLMKQCFDGSISGTIANPACVGYIAGYVGAIRMSSGVQGFPICLPEGGLSNESIVAEVSSYLEAKPDSLQKSARSVFFVVMSDRWPCPPGAQ